MAKAPKRATVLGYYAEAPHWSPPSHAQRKADDEAIRKADESHRYHKRWVAPINAAFDEGQAHLATANKHAKGSREYAEAMSKYHGATARYHDRSAARAKFEGKSADALDHERQSTHHVKRSEAYHADVFKHDTGMNYYGPSSKRRLAPVFAVQTGPRGGRFTTTSTGQKHYVGSGRRLLDPGK